MSFWITIWEINVLTHGRKIHGYQFCILLFFHGITMNGAATKVNVTWSLMESPIIFETTAYLSCYIQTTQEPCDGNIRQWIGGYPYRPLCIEKSCRNKLKYETMTSGKCSYVLVIKKFSVLDVNCDYTCLFGTVDFRHNLRLDEDNFEYAPNKTNGDVKINVTSVNDKQRVVVNIAKVYPFPKCYAKSSVLQEKQLLSSKNDSRNDVFYALEVYYDFPLSTCSSSAIICFFGKSNQTIWEKKDNCSVKFGETMQIAWIVVPIISITTVVITIGVLYQKRITPKVNSCRFHNNGHSEYDPSHTTEEAISLNEQEENANNT